MRWSGLKKKVESFFSPSLKGRVELRSTRYRRAHDQTGRGYITVDGREVWNMCSITFYGVEYSRIEEIKEKEQLSARAAQAIADTQLGKEGILSQWSYYEVLDNYCNSSIEANLASDDALIKSLAMLDSRLGKRRLEKLDVTGDHPMVQYFFRLRCAAENISSNTSKIVA